MRFLLFSSLALLLGACGNPAETSARAAALTAEPQTDSAAPDLIEPDGDDVWSPDYQRSSITFQGTSEGKSFSGIFKAFKLAINLDPQNLADAQIHAIIDPASAYTGDPQYDDSLPGKDWFDVKSYPAAEFISTRITKIGEGTYEAAGHLTLHGITQEIVLPFALSIEDNMAVATGEVSLNRLDFGVGSGDWFETDDWVGFEVIVGIDITATR